MSLSVADRLAILEVITRADEAASRRDAEAYVGLFTEDAVLDGTQGRHVGREALRSAVAAVWAAEGPATLHLILNPVVEPDPSGDRATTGTDSRRIGPTYRPRRDRTRRHSRSDWLCRDR